MGIIFSWLPIYGEALNEQLALHGEYLLYVILLILPVFSALLYYILIDRPSHGKWWVWLIYGLIPCIINLLISSQVTLQHKYDGLYDIEDINGEMICNVSASDCWLFGVANLIMALVVFLLFSLIFRRFSNNCKYVPIKL